MWQSINSWRQYCSDWDYLIPGIYMKDLFHRASSPKFYFRFVNFQDKKFRERAAFTLSSEQKFLEVCPSFSPVDLYEFLQLSKEKRFWVEHPDTGLSSRWCCELVLLSGGKTGEGVEWDIWVTPSLLFVFQYVFVRLYDCRLPGLVPLKQLECMWVNVHTLWQFFPDTQAFSAATGWSSTQTTQGLPVPAFVTFHRLPRLFRFLLRLLTWDFSDKTFLWK